MEKKGCNGKVGLANFLPNLSVKKRRELPLKHGQAAQGGVEAEWAKMEDDFRCAQGGTKSKQVEKEIKDQSPRVSKPFDMFAREPPPQGGLHCSSSWVTRSWWRISRKKVVSMETPGGQLKILLWSLIYIIIWTILHFLLDSSSILLIVSYLPFVFLYM